MKVHIARRKKINLFFGFLLITSVVVEVLTHSQFLGSRSEILNSADNFNNLFRLEMLDSVFGFFAMIAAMVFINRSLIREAKAEQEMKRFASLVKNSSDFIAIGGTDRKLQYLNPAGRKMVGYPEDKIVDGTATVSLYTKEDNQYVQDHMIPTLRSKGHWKGEFRFKHLTTDEVIPVQMSTFALYDERTHEVIGYATVSKDMREQKKIEKDLNRFFDVSLDMMAIANTKGYFLKINPAFTQILGYTEEELCSRPAIDFIHPDDIQPTIEQIKRQAAGNSVLSFENRYRTVNGDYRWFSWKSFPDGELTYGAARDITEDKKQKELMEKLSTAALSASQAKSEFLANMSHEIRTPINGVLGMTSLLQDTNLGSDQLSYVEDIQSSAQSLLGIINDILDFSKIEAGKLEIENLNFSLEETVNETVKAISWSLRNKSIPLIVNVEPAAKIPFRGDPSRIRQVLTNLLSNSAKFTEAGEIEVTVKVKSQNDLNSILCITVKDSGIGISKEVQEKLFQSFTQADASTSRKFGGTGLGLSISSRLVKLMGGEIGMTSQPQKGSEFWFTFQVQNVTSNYEKPKKILKFEKSKFPNARILVAEDNIINQKIILATLQKIGFNPQAVANGNEVISMLHEREFDLILMDCQMPEMDGYETTQRIRKSKSLNCQNIPIVAMTANALKGDKEKCLACGMNDYATKPINLEEVTHTIDKWLATSLKKAA